MNEQTPQDHSGLPSADDGQMLPEIAPPGELAMDPNCIVVYGSPRSGADEFTLSFERYLHEYGIPNARVDWTRSIDGIHPVFYGASHEDVESDNYVPTIPRGVVVFPEMRQYDPISTSSTGHTYSIDEPDADGGETIYDLIKRLCEKHDVPLIRFEA